MVMHQTSISKNESGRTMLEMFTVLVISGLLIMGFIHGYKWATDLHRANEMMHEMENRAITLATYYGRTGWPAEEEKAAETGEFGDKTKQGYAVEVTTLSNGMFVYAVRDVPVKVCSKVLRDWKLLEWLMVGSEDSNKRTGDLPSEASPYYYDFLSPDPMLCEKNQKTKNVAGRIEGQGVVDMFFWFHRDLDLCQGGECGTDPNGEENKKE